MTGSGTDRTLAMLRTFLDQVHIALPGELPDVVQQAAREQGWDAALYLVDHDQTVLVPVPAAGAAAASLLPLASTPAGEAFRLVHPVADPDDPQVLWLPLLDGADRHGVLRLALPAGTASDDAATQDAYRLLTHVVGHLITAKRLNGDALDLPRRLRSRTVASELLWQLLPPLTVAGPGLVISGVLQPCYAVAADAFDYSIDRATADLAILDATGHDLNGTLLAAVALAAYRNGRREGRALEETVVAIDDALGEQWNHEAYVTGVFARLDLRTGRLRYVNAGHPSPLLMRDGKVVKALEGGRRIILGLGQDHVDVAEEQLEPGDWVALYTDGVTEARATDGTFYGRDRLVAQLETSAASGHPAPETLRLAVHGVLEHQGGVLQDDATLVVLQWRTRDERVFFADRERL